MTSIFAAYKGHPPDVMTGEGLNHFAMVHTGKVSKGLLG